LGPLADPSEEVHESTLPDYNKEDNKKDNKEEKILLPKNI
jgi:hypothetical protein